MSDLHGAAVQWFRRTASIAGLLGCFALPGHAQCSPAEVGFITSVDPPRPRVGDLVRVVVTFEYPERAVRSEGATIRATSANLTVEDLSVQGTSGQSFSATFDLRVTAYSAEPVFIDFALSYEIADDCGGDPQFSAREESLEVNFSIEPASDCVGDCGGDSMVTVDELLMMVNIALGDLGPDACLAGDVDQNQEITVDELLIAINNALTGCTAGG